MLAVFIAGIWLILAAGSKLNSGQTVSTDSTERAETVSTSSTQTPNKFFQFDRSPLSVLLLQIIVIIVVAKIFAGIFRRMGQAPVMGEMVAGIALGPSILGWVSPQTAAFL